MKKFMSAFIVAALMVTFVACGSENVSPPSSSTSSTGTADSGGDTVKGSGSKKTYRILSGYAENNSAQKLIQLTIDGYTSEVDPDFKVEVETITSTNDLWEKLRLYVAAKNVPDMYSISNGTLSEEMIKQGYLVNMSEELKSLGHLDKVKSSLVDYFTSSDGNMYMIPSAFSGEYFVYRTSTFKKYGLEVPETWDDFLDICQKLKDNGEIPYVMRGADAVQYLRFMSFPSWTTEGREFINNLTSGKTTFSESKSGMYGAELLKKLGTSGYFIPGYNNLTLGDAIDTFIGGQGAMVYANTNYIEKFNDLYVNGDIGYFAVPVMAGEAGTGSTIPTHGGKAWTLNAGSYKDDAVLQGFFKYFMENVDSLSYEAGQLSWINGDTKDNTLPKLLSDIGNDMQKQTVSWVSWDDRLSAATLTTIGDAAEVLANGKMTVKEFAEIFDKALKDNKG